MAPNLSREPGEAGRSACTAAFRGRLDVRGYRNLKLSRAVADARSIWNLHALLASTSPGFQR